MASAQIELVRNDTLPVFGGTVDFDLTGYTVTVHFQFPIVLEKNATILTAAASASTFEVVFIVGDLDVAVGTYSFEVQFDDGSAGIITYQEDDDGKTLKVKIKEEIA